MMMIMTEITATRGAHHHHMRNNLDARAGGELRQTARECCGAARGVFSLSAGPETCN